MPSHDRPQFVRQAINSVLWQTFDDFDLMIVENSEEKDTRDIVNKYIDKDKRIKIFYEDLTLEERHKDCIVSTINNKYMDLAEGKYIFFFSDDDILFPNCLEEFYKFSESINGECSHCMQLWLQYHNGIWNWDHIHGFPNVIFNEYVTPSCKCTGGAILIRKEFLQDLDKPYFPLNPLHCATADAVFFEKLAKKHPIYPLNQVLSIQRFHKGNRSFEWWRPK